MANTLKDSQSNVIVGAVTSYTHTCAETGQYLMSATCTEVPTSALVITLAQTGSRSASASTSTPTDQQQSVNIQKVFNCTAADVLTISFSAPNVSDKQLNTVKTIVRVGRIA